jgi:glycogen debranching enzyme
MPKGRVPSSGGNAGSHRKAKPAISIPTHPRHSMDHNGRSPAGSSSPVTPVTPKTPADEGIEFFQSDLKQSEKPIRVYELRLDPDGGPSKETSVSYLIYYGFSH